MFLQEQVIGKRRKVYQYNDTNSKVAEGMLHAGLSQVGVNRFLACLEIPPPDQKSLKRREREIGPVIERIAKET